MGYELTSEKSNDSSKMIFIVFLKGSPYLKRLLKNLFHIIQGKRVKNLAYYKLS